MAKNLGIDFGSTYTMLSYYDKDNDRVTPIQLQNGSRYIPSIACENPYDEGFLYGQSAKSEISVNRLTPLRAFKMLLSEQDPDVLQKEGYDGTVTPREVTRSFLSHYTTAAAEQCSTQKFDSAVICIPEIWTRNPSLMSCRSILLDICREFGTEHQPLLGQIRVVTEPVAASAYYVHQFHKHEGRPYVGKLIIIDYGGGTLDITLTDVQPARDGKTMMIDALCRTGSGENHDGRIGNAGLAYMEEVTRQALKDAGFPGVPMDSSFMIVKDRLENELMSNVGKITAAVSKYRFQPDKFESDESVFVTCGYRGKKIPITYGLLCRVFNSLIKPVLNENLAELKEKLDKLHLDPLRDMDKLRIAVVGGFGQFPLVQKAVWDFFGYTGNAMDITHGAAGGKQDAISFGAALIAANEITVSNRSRYSIGMYLSVDGKDSFEFAIRCRKEVKYGKVYPVGSDWESIRYGGTSKPDEVPWIFAISDSSENFDDAYKMTPRQEILDMLQEKIDPGRYVFGFSMDESEIYTLHIYPVDLLTQRHDPSRGEILRLGNFNDIFGMNAVFNKNKMLHRIK